MSARRLYSGFGNRGDQYVSNQDKEGEMIVRIEAPRESLRCPACGSSYIYVVERFRRWWRTVPIGAKPVWIEMDVPRVECQSCHLRRRVEVTFAEPMWRHWAFDFTVESRLVLRAVFRGDSGPEAYAAWLSSFAASGAAEGKAVCAEGGGSD